MNRKELLQDKNFYDLHTFLSKFLFQTESKVFCFLKERNLDKHLVKKLVQYCDIAKCKLLQGDKKITLIVYGLSYTFFEDLEDNRIGDCPNDVSIGFVIRLGDINDITLTRDITSDYLD